MNVSEEGWVELAELLLGLGVGVEAGLESVEDARRLAAGGLADRCLRILVEIEDGVEGGGRLRPPPLPKPSSSRRGS